MRALVARAQVVDGPDVDVTGSVPRRALAPSSGPSFSRSRIDMRSRYSEEDDAVQARRGETSRLQ